VFHANTQKLIDEWCSHRITGDMMPSRTSISPVAFGKVLPQLFMLGGRQAGDEVFRLCGGLLADLHGRDMKGEEFLTLWRKSDRYRIVDALARARRNGAPLVATAEATAANGESIGLEVTLAPLIGLDGEADRIIGLYQPISMTARLVGKPVTQLHLRDLQIVDNAAGRPRSRANLKLVVDNGRRVA
jgi:hypothetical protein